VSVADYRPKPHSLAGATILQIMPSLRDDPAGYAALNTARALLEAGARAIVAGESGPLSREFDSAGAEWLPMTNDTVNPLRIRRNARLIEQIIAGERVDIVHAQSASSAWSTLAAIRRVPAFLVTSFPDRMPSRLYPGTRMRRSLAMGKRIIAPSSYISSAMIERYGIPAGRVTVIPRAVDTATFSPTAVSPGRVVALRRGWGVSPHIRVVLVPGPIVPSNGQMTMIEAARLMVAEGHRDVVFFFAGDDRMRPRFTRALHHRARLHGIDAHCRFIGHCPDMPAAMAAADVVVVPAIKPPISGRTAVEAQAMGRPVVVSSVGMLPENVLCPPRMPDDLRTGWLFEPGKAEELAGALDAALRLNTTAYEALGSRARQFAEFMFSPHSVAEAIRGVYTSLLARDE
jgi:glycosyltransferase involved in cell wall biosynthesis